MSLPLSQDYTAHGINPAPPQCQQTNHGCLQRLSDRFLFDYADRILVAVVFLAAFLGLCATIGWFRFARDDDDIAADDARNMATQQEEEALLIIPLFRNAMPTPMRPATYQVRQITTINK